MTDLWIEKEKGSISSVLLNVENEFLECVILKENGFTMDQNLIEYGYKGGCNAD